MLPQVDNLGRVFTAPGGTPAVWNSGVGYTLLGQVCTTQTLGANDQWVGGWRLDPVGRVVVAAGAGVFFNGGLPFNVNGALIGQPNVVPLATDPYVRGMRVGTAGVYGVNAVPPVLTGFSDGFSEGFGS